MDDDFLKELQALEVADLPSNKDLSELTDKVNKLDEIRVKMEKATDLLKLLGEAERHLSTEIIPELMDKLDLSKVALKNGQVVSCRPFYQGKIRSEHEEQAFDWLEQNGHGGVVKGNLTIPFAKGDKDKIVQIGKSIKQMHGIDVEINQSVHHSTMKALIREINESGKSMPGEHFDVFIGRKTYISKEK